MTNQSGVLTIACRDQAMAFIRDNVNSITVVANCYPDSLVRALANFALAEYQSFPEIQLVEADKEDA